MRASARTGPMDEDNPGRATNRFGAPVPPDGLTEEAVCRRPLVPLSGRAGWNAGPGHVPGCAVSAVMPLIRSRAVTPTAMAPTTEKTVCQTGDGMAIWVTPWVAL